MDEPSAKEVLHRYLARAREAMIWKLDGLDEYDARRPLTPTGTNLLGLVKHLAMGEATYFGSVFDRPFPGAPPWWDDDAEDNVDMWATADESRGEILDFYRAAIAHADDTILSLPLGAPGVVPWWQTTDVTLHGVLVHVLAETSRHAGHADVLRERLDGAAGLADGRTNLPPHDAAWWDAHVERLERAARAAAVAAAAAPVPETRPEAATTEPAGSSEPTPVRRAPLNSPRTRRAARR